MLVDCVITPDAFDIQESENDLHHESVLVELLRRLVQLGYLANLEDGRIGHEIKSLLQRDSVRPAFRDQVTLGLKLLADRNLLVSHPAGAAVDEDDDFRWLRRAILRHAEAGFDAVFTSDAYRGAFDGDRSTLDASDRALLHPVWSNDAWSRPGYKTESEFLSRLKPLLKYAGRISLIDPYLSPHKDGYVCVIKACAASFGSHRKPTARPRTIEIHAGDPERAVLPDSGYGAAETAAQRLFCWENVLQPIADEFGHKFVVRLWGRQPNGRRFHDRWIVTDQAAVAVGAGLDAEDEQTAPLTTWSLLPYDSRVAVLRGFSSSSTIFKPLGLREISPPG